MTRLSTRPVANASGATVLLLLISDALLIAIFLEGPQSWGQLVVSVVSAVAVTAVGIVIAARQPGNPAGWLLLAGGLFAALTVFDLAYAPAGLPAAAYVEWLTSMLSVPVFTGVVVLLLLTFPDGHLAAPRWSIATRAWASGTVLFSAVNGFSPELLDAAGFTNPLAVFGGDSQPLALDIAALSGAVLVASAIVGSAVSAVLRYRRSHGVERQQMKWFAATVPVMLLSAIGSAIIYESGREEIASIINAVAVMTFPVAIGIAVMRYRLYEIDRIINRTVVYAVVATVLTGLFAGSVAIASTLLPTGSGDLGIAASTLAVAALFNPLRHRVQRVVDRRFHRTHYDPQQIAEGLSVRLRDKIDPEKVGAEWVDAVTATLRPWAVGLWVGDDQ